MQFCLGKQIICRNRFFFCQIQEVTQKSKPKSIWFTRMKYSMGLGFGFLYLAYKQGQIRYKEMHFAHMFETLPDAEVLTQQYFGDHKIKQLSFFRRFLINVRRWIRGLHLLIKFFPVALTLPLAYLFKSYIFDLWLKYLLYTIQSSGPLWIKLGQWASHRGDIFGIEVTNALESLRDASKIHNIKETHKQFEKEFGLKIFDAFEFFNEKAVASGSIAQIYKARLNGQNVAVKVRHPNIIEELELDIKIWYTVAQFLGRRMIKQIAMPLTFEEFKRSLVNQTDLRFEAKNLEEFNTRFAKNPNVIFPVPVQPYISASILVESWEEGIPLTKFLAQERGTEHLTLANLGLKMFYKMLIYDNFIHADCHAGNMFVRITPRHINYDKMSFLEKAQYKIESFQDKIYSTVEEIVEFSINKLSQWQISKSGTNEKDDQIKQLEYERKQDENEFNRILQKNKDNTKDVKLIFLDPGMVTILNKSDRIAFIKLVMYVTLRKPIECGYLMLDLAQYHANQQVDEKIKQKFIHEIQDLFSEITSVPIAQMNIGQVLRGILDRLRANDMAIEGHFAALLTNLIVLEGIVKILDPSINIVAKATTFLLHLRTIDKTIDEIIQQTL